MIVINNVNYSFRQYAISYLELYKIFKEMPKVYFQAFVNKK